VYIILIIFLWTKIKIAITRCHILRLQFTKEKLHENACQKLHPDSLKMHQKAFGGRAAGGA